MNEAARLQMLDAIGITPLVPRFVLPGAKASVQGERVVLDAVPAQPVANTAAVQPPVPQFVAQQPPPAGESASGADTPARTKPASNPRIDIAIAPDRKPAEKSAAVASDNHGTNEPARVQVSLYQHNAKLLSLLPLYRADFQQEADQFMAAVIKSLGVQPQPGAPQVFRWPFVNNPKLDQGINALRQALEAFVANGAQQPESVLLLWGADLLRYLPAQATGAPGEFVLGKNLRVIVARRIQDYFNEPQLKRELWQQIRALKL